MAILLYARANENQLLNHVRRTKPKIYRQAQTHWLKFYKQAVIESEARTAVVQLKSEA